MPSPTRRSLLAGLATVSLSVSGCLATEHSGVPNERTRTETRTASGSGPPATDRVQIGEPIGVGDRTATVLNPHVRKMVVKDTELWGDLAVGPGQFLLVDVTTASGNVLSDEYTEVHELPLTVASDWRPLGGEAEPTLVADVPPDRPPTDPEDLETHAVGVPVPTGEVDAASVVWRTSDRAVHWELAAETWALLARVPAFVVHAVETAVVDGGIVELTVSVENTGDRDGIWLAQVSEQSANDISDVRGYTIPAGETLTRTVRPPILGERFGGFQPGRTVVVQFDSTRRFQREVTIPTATPTRTDA